MGIKIIETEKEGHRKVKTKGLKKRPDWSTRKSDVYGTLTYKSKKVTSKGEEAAVYDVEKTKGNSYNAVNRHLIKKLRG